MKIGKRDGSLYADTKFVQVCFSCRCRGLVYQKQKDLLQASSYQNRYAIWPLWKKNRIHIFMHFYNN